MKQKSAAPEAAAAENRIRRALFALLVIEAIAASGLARKTSLPPIVFWRYDPVYFAFLVVYLGLMIATAYLIWKPGLVQPFVTRVAAGAQWLRKRWWLAAALTYGAIEGWYGALRLIGSRIDPAIARRPVMTALLLGIVWLFGIMLFAGQSDEGRRATRANLILGLASAILTFWLGSVVYVRALDGGRYLLAEQKWGHLFSLDYEIGYTGRPNLDNFEVGDCPQEVTPVLYSTDADGFKNPPGIEDAPIVIVGDSYTFGTCLNNDEMWSAHLSEDMGVEVANYALPGFGLWHYNKLIDRYVRRGEHDVLVYGLYNNDLVSEPDFDHSFAARVQHNNTVYMMSPVTYTGWYLFRQSPTLTLTQGFSQDGPGEKSSGPAYVTLDNGMRLTEPPRYIRLIKGIDSFVADRLQTAMDYADEMDMTFVLVTIPSEASVYIDDYRAAFPDEVYLVEREYKIYEDICKWVRARGGYCLNLTDGMREEVGGERMYFTTDPHWNSHGATIGAKLLTEFLAENGIYP